ETPERAQVFETTEDEKGSDDQPRERAKQPDAFGEPHGNLRNQSERSSASSASNNTPGISKNRYRSSYRAVLASKRVFSSLFSTSWKLACSAVASLATYISPPVLPASSFRSSGLVG